MKTLANIIYWAGIVAAAALVMLMVSMLVYAAIDEWAYMLVGIGFTTLIIAGVAGAGSLWVWAKDRRKES